MATWNGTYESSLNQDTVAGTLDSAINGVKQEVRHRMENQHLTYDTDDDDDAGERTRDWLHTYGSAVVHYGAAPPTTNLTDKTLWWETGDGILYAYDETENEWQVVAMGPLEKEVRLWYGLSANIPTGWYICNGQTVNGNTLPDLIDLYIKLGATADLTGGGNSEVTIAEVNLPAHTHTIVHTHDTVNITGSDIQGAGADTGMRFTEENTPSTFVGNTWISTASQSTDNSGSVGSGTALDINPTYKGLIPICWIGSEAVVDGP